MYASPPGGTERLTPEQQHTLQCWLEQYHKHALQDAAPLRHVLVIAGEKPVTVLQQSDWKFDGSPFASESQVVQFLTTLGLAARQMQEMPDWFIGHARGRLDLLPSTAYAPKIPAWHRRLGTVFGYPPADIDHFIAMDEHITPHERIENGAFSPAEIAYTAFLFHKHDDSIAGYERAIETGKAIRACFAEIATQWDLPIIETIAEDYYQLSLDVYTGEREAFPGERTGFRMIARG